MAMYDEYVAVLEEQRLLYGPMTLVLYQVGTFWEILDCDQHTGCDVPVVASILNIQVTRRNKNILEVSRTNNSLAGFNVCSLSKYLPLLVAALYTVVLVSEVPQSGKATVTRQITRVVSKGTWMEDPAPCKAASQRIACLHMQGTVGQAVTGCGFASLDLRTGRCEAFEILENQDMKTQVFEDLCSHVASLHVVELLITGDKCLDDVSRLRVAGILHNNAGKQSIMNRSAIQDLILRKAYPETGFLTAAEFIGLERSPLALTAFVTLVDFTHRHDETIVRNLPVPTSRSSTASHVLMSPTSLQDLDILHETDNTGLCTILNTCLTGMGRRLFHERLTRPINDVCKLRARYDQVEAMMQCCHSVRAELKGTGDIERSWRRITSYVSPRNVSADVVALRVFLLKAVDAFNASHTSPSLHPSIAHIRTIINSINVIDDAGLITQGTFVDVDEARSLVASYAASKDDWMQQVLLQLGPLKAHLVKFAASDDPCAHATCTPKRFVEVEKVLGAELALVLDESPKCVRFTGLVLRNSAAGSANARLSLEIVIARRLRCLVDSWCGEHNATMVHISRSIAALDVYACIAADAIKNDMVRPSIQSPDEIAGDTSATGSRVLCESLRHPLAERINQHILYVPNDLTLSSEGMLLYGVNASGKSSLSKALALAVVMAQAGMFVACKRMDIRLFDLVLTRVASRDDIYRGRSTFMVELMELRDILKRANARTLVVGDELCSGTESASAISIVGAVCLHLVAVKSCFILATHLHELSRLSHTRDDAHIKIFHLGVTYDLVKDVLIYDRKILIGPGKALYGLEVARSMHMPLDFMEKAHEIRREILGINHSIVNTKRSHFNSKVFVDVCGACGAPAQETHHIVPQRLANASGQVSLSPMGASFHKDAAHNLVPLCQKCHLNVHASVLTLHGYVASSRGVRLSGEGLDDAKSSR